MILSDKLYDTLKYIACLSEVNNEDQLERMD